MPHYFRDSTITTLMLISITSMVFRIVGIRTLSFNELLSHGTPLLIILRLLAVFISAAVNPYHS